jgi:hypothetical protein
MQSRTGNRFKKNFSTRNIISKKHKKNIILYSQAARINGSNSACISILIAIEGCVFGRRHLVQDRGFCSGAFFRRARSASNPAISGAPNKRMDYGAGQLNR